MLLHGRLLRAQLLLARRPLLAEISVQPRLRANVAIRGRRGERGLEVGDARRVRARSVEAVAFGAELLGARGGGDLRLALLAGGVCENGEKDNNAYMNYNCISSKTG